MKSHTIEANSIKESRARYYQENKEEIIRRAAEYRSKNKEKIKEYHRIRRITHKEKIAESKRARHLANKEKLNAISAAYRMNNKRKIAIGKSRWKSENKEMVKQSNQARRARKKNATVGDLTQIAAWEKAWKSSKRVVCFWCFESVAPNTAHTDHVIPLSKGGSHSIENLCISCAKCNLRKHDKSLSAWNSQIAQPVLL